MPLENLPMPSSSIIKGDAKSASIAAASIIAKVTRDRLMDEYDKLYPEYVLRSTRAMARLSISKRSGSTGPARFIAFRSSPCALSCSSCAVDVLMGIAYNKNKNCKKIFVCIRVRIVC